MLLSGVYQPEESQSQEQLLRCTLPLKLANLSQRYGKYYLLTEWEGWMGKYLACGQDDRFEFSDGVNLHRLSPIT